jgi:hypothetical protein
VLPPINEGVLITHCAVTALTRALIETRVAHGDFDEVVQLNLHALQNYIIANCYHVSVRIPSVGSANALVAAQHARDWQLEAVGVLVQRRHIIVENKWWSLLVAHCLGKCKSVWE